MTRTLRSRALSTARLFRGEEYVLDWIVERKRVDDLAASIIDRRYEQQKYWLRRCRIANIVYLVEGDPSTVERSKTSSV